jgi:pre-rRNA-processing protein IPI1
VTVNLIRKRTTEFLLVLQHDLAPHSSTLLLFTTSAQTHIFPEIQIDAIQFLDLYLDMFPDVVVRGWRDGKSGHGRRILEGYLSILGAGTKLGEGGAYRLFSSPLSDRSSI